MANRVMPVQIEASTAADYAAIASIYNAHIASGKSSMDERCYEAEDIAAWVAGFSDREGLFVLREGLRVLGWGIIKRYSDRFGYRFTCETAVYLNPEEVGKGYGTTMKRFLIEQCRRWEYRHLVAKIFSSNTASIRYNEKLGYEIVGEQRHVGFKNGEWINVTIMQYLIDA